MCHSFLHDASFYEQLTHLDKQIAQAVQARGYPHTRQFNPSL
jgi:hypothetical protein